MKEEEKFLEIDSVILFVMGEVYVNVFCLLLGEGYTFLKRWFDLGAERFYLRN